MQLNSFLLESDSCTVPTQTQAEPFVFGPSVVDGSEDETRTTALLPLIDIMINIIKQQWLLLVCTFTRIQQRVPVQHLVSESC